MQSIIHQRATATNATSTAICALVVQDQLNLTCLAHCQQISSKYPLNHSNGCGAWLPCLNPGRPSADIAAGAKSFKESETRRNSTLFMRSCRTWPQTGACMRLLLPVVHWKADKMHKLFGRGARQAKTTMVAINTRQDIVLGIMMIQQHTWWYFSASQ